jgi:ATP-dependent Lon protease
MVKTSPKNTMKYNTRNSKKNKLKKNKPDSDDDSDDENINIELDDEDGDEYDEDYETCSEEDEDDEDDEDDDDEDSSYKPYKHKSNKSKKTKKSKKNMVIEDEDEDEDDTDKVLNRTKLHKFLSKIFPSKYMQKKVEEDLVDGIKEGIDKAKRQLKKKSKKSKLYRKGKLVVEDEDEDEDDEEDEDDDEDEEDDEDEYDDEDELEYQEGDNEDVVWLTFGGPNGDTDEYNDAEDDVDCNSDDEQMFMKETYQQVEMPSIPEVEKKKAKKEKLKSKVTDKKKKDENSDLDDVECEYLDLVDTKKQLTTQLHKRPKSKILLKAIEDCDRSIKKLVKKARIKNAKTYHKLIHDDNKNTNEVDYFKKNLSNKEQLRVMKDLKEINKHINVDKPYRLALLESNIPPKLKAIALQKLNILKQMDPGDNEYYKLKHWVDAFMKIPFGTYKDLTIKIEDGVDVCHDFMLNAMTILDNCVYGLNDAKLQIMQMLGQWITNPSAVGTAIAIKGPPGTGKTSLVKEGISKILGREFAFIALGGSGDSSFLEGHSYTYEGSTWGKIVQIIIDSKCMNPVIYFDELDKISETPRGEEIVGILTHLTDTSQNSQFHDKYFSEVDFDLSKCLFIFSYNDESKVNPILRDRMYRIQTKGYDAKEKLIIARKHLLPKIREQVKFTEEEVIIPDDTIQYIVSNANLTNDESGVRNLKRCLEIIHTKLNLFRLVKSGTENTFTKEIPLSVTFPFTVTRKDVDVFIKNNDKVSQSMLAMYC